MSTPPFLTPPHQHLDLAETTWPAPEPVWGAPSEEMLQSERNGDVVLIEDITRRSSPREWRETP